MKGVSQLSATMKSSLMECVTTTQELREGKTKIEQKNCIKKKCLIQSQICNRSTFLSMKQTDKEQTYCIPAGGNIIHCIVLILNKFCGKFIKGLKTDHNKT